MTDHDLWRHLEADFARVLGEIPKPEGPELNELPRNPWELETDEWKDDSE